MRLVPLLIFWTVSVLQPGGHDQSRFCDGGESPRGDLGHSVIVVHGGTGDSIPGDPGAGSLGSSFEDEEDTLEDGFLGGCVSVGWRWPDTGPGNLSCALHMRHNLLRIPSPLILCAVEIKARFIDCPLAERAAIDALKVVRWDVARPGGIFGRRSFPRSQWRISFSFPRGRGYSCI